MPAKTAKRTPQPPAPSHPLATGTKSKGGHQKTKGEAAFEAMLKKVFARMPRVVVVSKRLGKNGPRLYWHELRVGRRTLYVSNDYRNRYTANRGARRAAKLLEATTTLLQPTPAILRPSFK